MASAKDCKKNIACLETLWDQNIKNRLDVVPILELVSKVSGAKYIHLTCNTSEELEYNLGKLKRRQDYRILYLSFHGKSGRILLDKAAIDLETLAVLMGKDFTNWIVYFGSCSTIGVPKHRIASFIRATQVSMVVGHKKDVDWMDSAAIDLLLLHWLQSYKDMRRVWVRFENRYQDLISITGLTVFHR